MTDTDSLIDRLAKAGAMPPEGALMRFILPLLVGAVLCLTGTSLVPPDEVTLQAGDRVVIEIESIGTLENHVVRV